MGESIFIWIETEVPIQTWFTMSRENGAYFDGEVWRVSCSDREAGTIIWESQDKTSTLLELMLVAIVLVANWWPTHYQTSEADDQLRWVVYTMLKDPYSKRLALVLDYSLVA